jgi:serine/threonine protein phosphatase PrpC
MNSEVKYVGFGATHLGKRSHNEDAYFIDDALGLYIVADGVGGQDAGEVASQIVCDVIAERVRAGESLYDAVRDAHFAIANAVSRGEGRPGMASTVVALLIRGDLYEITWLGDSRAYLWDGHLKLLSRDHSLVETLLSKGEIGLDEARSHPKKNVILAALGGGDINIPIGQNAGVLRSGTKFMLCSDGLTDVVEPKRIAKYFVDGIAVDRIAEYLVEDAVAANGRDNITAIIVDVTSSPNDVAQQEDHAEVVRTYDPLNDTYTYHP